MERPHRARGTVPCAARRHPTSTAPVANGCTARMPAARRHIAGAGHTACTSWPHRGSRPGAARADAFTPSGPSATRRIWPGSVRSQGRDLRCVRLRCQADRELAHGVRAWHACVVHVVHDAHRGRSVMATRLSGDRSRRARRPVRVPAARASPGRLLDTCGGIRCGGVTPAPESPDGWLHVRSGNPRRAASPATSRHRDVC